MYIKRRTFTLAVLAAAPFTVSPSAWPTPSDEEIRRLLARRVDEAKQATAIVVGIVAPGKQRVVSYGSLESGSARLPDGNTVFEIGSVTKVLTALLLADMVQRGEVTLKDPVASYLAGGSAGPVVTLSQHGETPITLADLATHTSGLPNMPDNFHPKDGKNPHADYTVDQLYAYLSSYQPTVEAGKTYVYSNLGAGLLGHVLSRRAGQSFTDLVRKRITAPLRMRDTRSTPTVGMAARLAPGHNDKLVRAASWDTHTLAGAGGYRSTVNDLMILLEVFLSLRPSTLQPAMKAMLDTQRSGGLGPSTHTALGWMLIREGEQQIAWHPGRTGGYRAFLGYNLLARIGVVGLTNASTETGVDDIGLHLLDPRFPLANPQLAKQREAVVLDPSTFERYAGRYRVSPTLMLNIFRTGARLYVQAGGWKKQKLFAESEGRFFLKSTDVQVWFESSPAGPAPALILRHGGWERRGVRIE